MSNKDKLVLGITIVVTLACVVGFAFLMKAAGLDPTTGIGN